jgi:hypothetical protein
MTRCRVRGRRASLPPVLGRRRRDCPLLLDVRTKFCSIRFTQEVRDFAAKQNATANTFLAVEEANKGMVDMRDKFGERSGEIYLPISL